MRVIGKGEGEKREMRRGRVRRRGIGGGEDDRMTWVVYRVCEGMIVVEYGGDVLTV